MKNKLLIFSILILCTSSCNYLEYDESDFLEKDAVFSSFQYTRDFLTNIYSYVPAAFGTIGGDASTTLGDIDALAALKEQMEAGKK